MARSTNPLGLTDYQWQLLRWSANPASTWREYGQLFTTGGNPGTLKALYRHELIEEGLYRRDPAQRQALETMIRDSLIQAAEELPGGQIPHS